MGNGPIRTDYMSTEEFRRREREQKRRGDEPIGPHNIRFLVDFDANFDRFVASVAHGIRHHVVYRRDGGHFARGLVRASDELKEIHESLKKNAALRGGQVRLNARLYRRKASRPTDRWAMYVVFETPDVVNEDEGEFITASYDVTQNSEVEFAKKVLDIAEIITGNPAWNPPNKWGADRVRRIRDWVWLAKRLGDSGYKHRWYYKLGPLRKYTHYLTTSEQRRLMTAATQGKLAFKGNTGVVGGAEPWREYPFLRAVTDCRKSHSFNVDDCADHIGQVLKEAEDEIFESINKLNENVQMLGPAANQFWWDLVQAPQDYLHKDVKAFIKHFGALFKDPDTLYFTYTKYSQANLGIWAKF